LVDHVFEWPRNAIPPPLSWYFSYAMLQAHVDENLTLADYCLEAIDSSGANSVSRCLPQYLNN